MQSTLIVSPCQLADQACAESFEVARVEHKAQIFVDFSLIRYTYREEERSARH